MTKLTQSELNEILEQIRTGSIKDLNLSNKEISPEQVEIILAKLIESKTELFSISTIGCTGITDQLAKYSAKILEANTLASLDLRMPSISIEGVLLVIEALKKNKSLVFLTIGRRTPGLEFERVFAQMLRQNTTLMFVNFCSTGDTGIAEIADTLQENTSLVDFNCYDGKMGSDGIKSVCSALVKNPSLISVGFGPDTELTPESSQMISWMLQNNTSLAYLMLPVDDDAMKIISCGLSINDSLIHISFRYDGKKMNSLGAQFLSESIKHNKSLTSIFFSCNNIGDIGAQSLASAIEINTGLTILNLQGNNIGDEGAIALAKSLEINKNLTELILYHNQIGDKGLEYFAKSLSNNYTLISLNLDRNSYGTDGYKYLSQINAIIARNRKSIDMIKSGNIEMARKLADAMPMGHKIAICQELILAITKSQTNRSTQIKILRFFIEEQSVIIADNILWAAKNNFEKTYNREIIDLIVTAARQYQRTKTLKPIILPSPSPTFQEFTTTNHSSTRSTFIAEEPINNPQKSNFYQELQLKSQQLEQSTLEQKITKLQLQHQEAETEIARISDQQLSSTSPFSPLPSTIDPKFTKTRADIAEQEHIKSKPHLLQYYNIIQKTFNEAFLFSNIISQGGVVLSQGVVAKSLAVMATLAGDIPFASVILSIAQSATDSFTSAKRAGKYANISDLNPNSDPIDSALLVEELARRFTITNAAKIESVASGRDTAELSDIRQFISRVKEDTKAQIAKQDPAMARGLFGTEKTLAELLAYKDSRTALEYILNGQLQDKSSRSTIIKEIVEAVTGLEETRLTTTISSSTTQIRKSATTTSLITPSVVNQASIPTPELSPITQGTSQLSSGTDIERILRITEDQAKAREKAHAQEIKKALEDQAKMLEEKMKKTQEEQAKAHTEAIRKLQAVEAESSQTKKTLEAVFQTVISGNDDQVTGAVRTREGATISVINPNLEARVSGIHQEHNEHREEVHNRLSHLERERSRRSKKSKTKCCVIL